MPSPWDSEIFRDFVHTDGSRCDGFWTDRSRGNSLRGELGETASIFYEYVDVWIPGKLVGKRLFDAYVFVKSGAKSCFGVPVSHEKGG